MKKIFLINLFLLCVPFLANACGFLPDVGMFDVIRNILLWLAFISLVLSVVSFIIFSIIYFIKDASGKKKIKKILFYSMLIFFVSLAALIIIIASVSTLCATSKF